VLKNPWLLFALVCGSIVSCGLLIATAYGDGIGLDFSVLWKAARSPISSIYTPDSFAPFVYPPSAIVWLRPLALLPQRLAFVLWSVASLGVFLAVAKVPRRAFLLVSPALVQCLAFGQTSLLIAGLILVTTEGSALGVLTGLAFSIKPQIVGMAPLVFMARGHWRAFGGFALAVFAAIALSVLLYGLRPWQDWADAIPAFHQTLINRNLFWVTITPAGTAERFGLDPRFAWGIGAVLAAIAAVRSKIQDTRAVVVYTSLLAAPYAVTHDLVALLPFCLVTLIEGGRRMSAALLFSGALAPLALLILAALDCLGVEIADRPG
jgi:alpha-1,2-mannosyltransferase